jgi:DNA-directed RNA polymerase specialized sigma24 family protein
VGDAGTSRRYARRDARPRTCRAGSVSYEAYYRSLVQLAALLTGDASEAEAAVAGALAAVPRSAPVELGSDDFLRYLQRRVIVQCRRSRRGRSLARHAGTGVAGTGPASTDPARTGPGGPDPANTARDGSDFDRLPVVMALRGLRPRGREAIVLTHYLDLPPAQAAAIAGVSEAVLQANLTTAMQDLGDLVTGPYPDS